MLSFLRAILCEKAFRGLRNREVSVPVNGQNVSLGEVAVELTTPQITQLLTLLHAHLLYLKTDVRVKNMFDDVFATPQLFIHMLNT